MIKKDQLVKEFKKLGVEQVLDVYVEAFPNLSLAELFKSIGFEKVCIAFEEAFPDITFSISDLPD